jgi:2-polyprenyl-3-methyl-5-hydroxy-6-metoxy-1,4-benzoquinol methylase
MSQQSWNLLASEFEGSVCDITATSGKLLAELVARTRPNRRHTLVDAGCGIGTFVERFGEQFGKVVAFDFASAMVKRARTRCRTLKHVTWNSMPLEKAAERIGSIAHLAVCLNVITSPDADLRKRQWESLAQLVRPGGRLLVVVPSLESARYTAELEAAAADLPPGSEPDLIRRTDTLQKHYSRGELRRQVTQRGMKVLSLRRIHYPWSEEGLDRIASKRPWDWVCLTAKAK